MSSSKKPKTTANIPRVGVTDPSYPMGDNRRRMEQGYGRPGGAVGPRSDDPLELIRFEERQDLYREYREAKEVQEKKKLELKIQQMKQDTGAGGLNIGNMYQFTPADIQQISRMPEKEQQDFYATLQQVQLMSAMQSRGGAQGGLGNPMLQMMAMGGFGRQGQGLGLKDVMEIQGMMKNIYDGAGRGNQDLTNTLLMKLMTETVPGLQQQANQATQQGLGAVISILQANQSDPMRDLNYLKEGAAALGYAPQNVSMDVAKLQLEMQDKWKAIEHEDRRKELDYRRQLGVMEKVLDAVTGLTKNVTRDHISTLFKPKPVQQVQPIPQVQPAPVTPVPQAAPRTNMVQVPPTGSPQIVKYQCGSCGADMYAPLGVSPVTCAQCGQVHEL